MGLRSILKKVLLINQKPFFIHKTVLISKEIKLSLGKKSELHEYVIIRSGKFVRIGEYSQVGPFCVFLSGTGIEIGKNVMIGPHCVLAAGNHDYKQLLIPMRFAEGISKGPIIIEDDVWIGANCTITDAIKIGNNAVIAANTVVTKNVDPYDIVAGNPGVVIGNRKKNDKL